MGCPLARPLGALSGRNQTPAPAEGTTLAPPSVVSIGSRPQPANRGGPVPVVPVPGWAILETLLAPAGHLTMRHSRRFAPLLLASLGLLVVYLWTLTESAAVTIHVADDRCVAGLYGRKSTIDCTGLAGGKIVTTQTSAAEPAISRGRGPLEWLFPAGNWFGVRITGSDGRRLSPDGPLPAVFAVRASLRRPNEPSGLVLLRPDGSGWEFLVDAEARRGVWWTWAGERVVPLQGIPLDRPFLAQAQTLVRQLLDGWQGALLLVATAGLLGGILHTWQARVNRKRGQVRAPAVGHGSSAHSRGRNLALAARTVLLALVLFAFGASLHIAVNVLDGIPHVQDSVTYLFQAQTLARGALTAPAPPLAEPDATAHFAQEFLLVRDGRWFGKYPPGYPALLALGVLAGAPWLVNPLLAAMTVALVYALARQLYGRGPWLPALAATLLAASPFFLVMSGSLMAHPGELFWSTLFMLAWTKSLPPPGKMGRDGGRWAVVAGAALGMLLLTRQFAALTVGLAFGGGWLWLAARTTAGRHQGGSSWAVARLAFSQACRGRLLAAFLAISPFLLVLPVYQAAVAGDARSDPRLLYWPYDRVGFGPDIGEAENAFYMSAAEGQPAIAWYTDPTQPPRGHSPARGLYNLGRNLDALETDLFGGPPLLALGFVWLAFLLRRPTAVDWLLLLTLLAVAGGYVAYWASGIAYGPRYFYAALPSLVILSARGISALAFVAGRRAVLILVTLLLAASLVRMPARLAAYRDYNFVSAAPRKLVEARVTPPALVFVTASDADWWEYGVFFSGNTPWLDGPVVYARDLGPEENARLAARFPGRSSWLWRDSRLDELVAGR